MRTLKHFSILFGTVFCLSLTSLAHAQGWTAGSSSYGSVTILSTSNNTNDFFVAYSATMAFARVYTTGVTASVGVSANRAFSYTGSTPVPTLTVGEVGTLSGTITTADTEVGTKYTYDDSSSYEWDAGIRFGHGNFSITLTEKDFSYHIDYPVSTLVNQQMFATATGRGTIAETNGSIFLSGP